MLEVIGKIVPKSSDTVEVSLSPENPDVVSRISRLKTAIRDAGGNQRVSERSGVPLSTLNAYLRGGEMKLSNTIALAGATGVRLAWLATGDGSRTDAEAVEQQAVQPGASPTDEGQDRELFATVHMDRLAAAYAAALKALEESGHTDPEPRRVMQVTVLFYDRLAVAEATPR